MYVYVSAMCVCKCVMCVCVCVCVIVSVLLLCCVRYDVFKAMQKCTKNEINLRKDL